MNCTFIVNQNNILSAVNAVPDIDLNMKAVLKNNVYWIDVRTDNRTAAIETLAGFHFTETIKAKLLQPGESIRLSIVRDQVLFDLSVCDYFKEQARFLTVILLDELFITICPEDTDYVQPVISKSKDIAEKVELTSSVLMFCLFDYILDNNTQFINRLKIKVGTLSMKIMGNQFSIDMREIEKLKNEVIMMEEVLENQFASFGLLPVQITKPAAENIDLLSRLVGATEHLQRVVERLEDKLDDIYEKYLYDLQGQTNRRINILTIIQSIFVPITFVAGLYGMNFSNMPELQWHSGYFYVLGLMGVITIFELIIFYIRGWFK